jgi:hypothetical protein
MEITELQSHELADAQARGQEQLNDQPVALAGARLQQAPLLVLSEHLRSLPGHLGFGMESTPPRPL